MGLNRLLLEEPTLLVISLVAAAVILQMTARHKPNKHLKYAPLIALAAAVGVSLLAWQVHTPRERVMQETRRLVDAAGPIDKGTLNHLISPHAVLLDREGQVLRGLDVATIAENLETREVGVHEVKQLDVEVEGKGRATSYLLVHSTPDHEVFQFPQRTRWAISWRQGREHWQAVSFRWIEWNGHPPEESFIR